MIFSVFIRTLFFAALLPVCFGAQIIGAQESGETAEAEVLTEEEKPAAQNKLTRIV